MKLTTTPKEVLQTIYSIVNPQSLGFKKAFPFLKEDTLVNEFSQNENSIRCIYDVENINNIQFSDNFGAFLVYSNNDIQNDNLLLALSLLHTDHFLFPVNVADKTMQMTQNVNEEKMDARIVKSTYVGLKIQHKAGHSLRILANYTLLNNKTNHKLGLVSIFDITHLMKGDTCWVNTKFAGKKPISFHFLSTDKSYQSGDIISEREKMVLRLIAQGLETKEIAEKLFLSPHTVDNHRRNMIARTHARDTTALVHICKMCGII